MNPIEWLEAHEGFGALSVEGRDSIRNFTLLWSLFEAKAMATRGSAASIVSTVDHMCAAGLLNRTPLVPALDYWRDRYWVGNVCKPAFEDLKFRPHDCRALVEGVMSGAEDSTDEMLKALLIIILRLRNNLFHGHKWATGFYDQQNNFDHACDVLMAALDMYRPLADAAYP